MPADISSSVHCILYSLAWHELPVVLFVPVVMYGIMFITLEWCAIENYGVCWCRLSQGLSAFLIQLWSVLAKVCGWQAGNEQLL